MVECSFFFARRRSSSASVSDWSEIPTDDPELSASELEEPDEVRYSSLKLSDDGVEELLFLVVLDLDLFLSRRRLPFDDDEDEEEDDGE